MLMDYIAHSQSYSPFILKTSVSRVKNYREIRNNLMNQSGRIIHHLNRWRILVHLFRRNDNAASDSFGVILMVAVTILLALLVLLMINIQPFAWNMEKEIPEIFTITAIESTDEITGHLNFDSRVILLHTGEIAYQNRNLTAKFFKNEQPVSCTITTMNGHDFIDTTHRGSPVDGGYGMFRGDLESRRADPHRFHGRDISPRRQGTGGYS